MQHHIALARNLLLATAVSAWNLAAEPTQAYNHGDPTPVEQYMLELINRARMNPTAEGVFLDTLDTAYSRSTRADKPEFFTTIRQEFASYPVAQPLAFHLSLTQAARNHAADMVSRNYFAHVTPEGLAPWDRTKAAGYPSQLVGENIDGLGMTTAADALRSHYNLMVDAYNLSHATHPLGHRLNVLDTDFSEIGIGSAGNAVSGKVVQNFGDNGQIFLLGVVFKDVNGNKFYDPGEGITNVTIKPSQGSYYAVSSGSGGYAIPIEPFETRQLVVPLNMPAVDGWTDVIQQKDAEFQAAYRATNAVSTTLTVTFSGASLASPVQKQITMNKPIRIDYQLVGTDGWYFTRTMYVGSSVKVDLNTLELPAASDVRVSIAQGSGSVTLTWTGGKAPYRVQRKTALTDAAWQDQATQVNSLTLVIPTQNKTAFFRVLSTP